METNKKSFLIRCRAIIFDENNKLLVVKHKPDSDYYALPGGHLEWGENVKECLEREIIEELGVHPQIGRLLYINNFIEEEKNRQSIEFFFEVTNGSDFLKIENLDRSHAYEISDLLWVDSNDSIKILPQKLGESFRQGNILSDTIRYI